MKLGNIPEVKANKVYGRLSQAIIEGRLGPGTYLREREVSAQFRVSRTPVREAIRQLARDGYVHLVPRLGAQVNDFSLQDLFEVYDVRRCLEPYAARLAAERLTASAEAELKDIRKTFEEEMHSGPSPEFFLRHMAADRRLHQLTLELAGNRRIAQVISHMTDISMLSNRRLASGQRIRRSAQEHLRIIDALLRKDAAAVEVAMMRHLAQSKEDMQDLILASLGASRIPVEIRRTELRRKKAAASRPCGAQ